jgi:hypothetical protein
MERTALYKRLPPDSGTPEFNQEVRLSGFRKIRIPSRIAAERQIHEFLTYCEREAGQPAARMVVGSWGEGKTEAFHQYIATQTSQRQHRSFLLTARSIANAYAHYAGLDTSEARLFLAAVFHVLRDDGVDGVPPCRGDALIPWIEQCLVALGCSKRKLFLFVDEVEQLLHEPQDLRRLMLGIKQMLDGTFAGAMQQPSLAVSVFVFFACTPEAYNRIATDPDVRQVFGGYGRRMDKIHVESISLAESVHFLYGLLQYAWDDHLPRPLPVRSPGVLVALATIAKRNMGQMVSLMTRLLSAQSQAGGRMDVIGFEQIQAFATGRTINIEGNEAKCFEDQLYTLLLEKMSEADIGGDSYRRLLTALLFDQRAYSTRDVAGVVGTESWAGLERLWVRFLQQALARMSYSPGLLAFRHGTTLQHEALFTNLASFADPDRLEVFRFGEKVLSRREVEDLLSDWRFTEQADLQQTLLIPADAETVQHLFGPLPSGDAERLVALFRDLGGAGDMVYRLPKDLIDQLFPPPCPPGLEFVRDASERFNLWRRATVEYERRITEDLPRALMALASRLPNQRWTVAAQESGAGPGSATVARLQYQREAPPQRIPLEAWILSRPGIRPEDLRRWEEQIVGAEKPPHLFLILHTDPVEDAVLQGIPAHMQHRACLVHVHPTYAKQMLASYWHLAGRGAVYEDVLHRSCASLLERDLRLYTHLNRWLTEARRSGLAVDNPALTAGPSYAGLPKALRLLLNAQGTELTLENIFNWNWDGLRRLVPYGTRSGLLPETDRLESLDGFRSLVGDLQTNGFVHIDPHNRPRFTLSPCEEQILASLSEEELLKDALKGHLLVLASPDSILEEVYVEALVLRGLVERKKGRGRGAAKNVRKRLQPGEVCQRAVALVEDFQRRVEGRNQQKHSFITIAHMAVVKERDLQVITLADVLALIDERLQFIRSPSDPLVGAANAVFLTSFLEETGDRLLRIAWQAGEKVHSATESLAAQYNEYQQHTIPRRLATVPFLLHVSIDIASLAEVAELRAIKEAADGILEEARHATADTLRQQIEALQGEEKRDFFWHADIDKEGCCHNYYAYRAYRCEKSFGDKRTVLDRLLSNVGDRLQSPVNRRDNLYRQVLSFDVGADLPVTQMLLEALKTALQPAPMATAPKGETPHAVASLRELTQMLDEQFAELNRAVGALESCRETLDRTWQAETTFSKALEDGRNHLAAVRVKFNLPEQADALAELESFFAEGQSKYVVLCKQSVAVEPLSFDRVRRELLTLAEHFGEVDNLVRSELWQPFALKRQGICTTLGRRIQACEALGTLPELVREHYRLLGEYFEKERSLEQFLQGPASCAEQLEKADELSHRTGEILSRHLSEAENDVLGRIMELSSQVPASAGIDLDRLKGRTMTKEQQNQLLCLVGELWAKGVIAVRIGL